MVVLPILLGLALLLGLVRGDADSDPDIQCLNGIRTAIALFTFANGTTDGYWGTICDNDLGVHSMWASAKLYCTPTQIGRGGDLLGSYCLEYGSVELVPYSKLLPEFTEEYMASLPVVEFTDVDPTKVWNNSFVLSKNFYSTGYRTVSSFERQYLLHAIYGWAIYGFWGGLILIGMLNRITRHILESSYTGGAADQEAIGSSGKSPRSGPVRRLIHTIDTWIRTNLTTPAMFGTHHQRLLWGCTIPTRMESVIVAAYWILNIILCCVSYELFYPNLYYTFSQQGWRYVADRTGIICYANLPFLWMFAGRNNIFLWLTGWSYSTFNIFHRNIARLAVILAVLHSVCYTILEYEESELAESWTEQYWYMGGMATIAMSFLFILSISWMRLHKYEIFLLIHIVMSVVTIIGLFYHTKIFDGEYDGYLWPLVAIWLFDRVARLARVFYTHMHLIFAKSTTQAAVTAIYDEKGDYVRLQVSPSRLLAKPNGGQHYFLYQPNRWRFYENHPFTLAGWNQPAGMSANPNLPSGPPTESPVPEATIKELNLKVQPEEMTSSESNSVNSSQGNHHPIGHKSGDSHALTFILRPFDGWTKRLRNECIKSPTHSIKPKIYIEGPYGEQSPVHLYENVMFVAGGSGITAVLPYLQDYLTRRDEQQTRTRDITCIWSTKQLAMVHSIAANELKPYLTRRDMHISLHATSVKASLVDDVQAGKTTPAKSSEIEILTNRPDVRECISDVVNKAYADGTRQNRTAVFCCGPAGMSDEARAAVHEVLRAGKADVKYFEDTFGW